MDAWCSMLARIGARDAAGLTPRSPGGATRSLIASTSSVALTAALVWQGIMVILSLAALGQPGWILATFQALVGVLAAFSIRSRRWGPALPPAMVAMGVWGYLLSGDLDSSLTFAACWQINFSAFFAGLLILQRYAIWMVVGSAVCTSVTILHFLPDWGAQLPASILVTQASIIIAIRLGLGALLRHSSKTDESVELADEASLRDEALTYQSARLAEDSRVLHDTAINTFAAIASAGAGARDVSRVITQCARDLELIEELRGARRTTAIATLLDVFEQPGITTIRQGAGDEAIQLAGTALPQRTVDGIIGCVREAVTNATKHSGANHVDVEVLTSTTELVVRVSDDGIGFREDTPAGRGVDASIRRRAIDHNFAADVRSTLGMGTVVTLSIALAPLSADQTENSNDAGLEASASTVNRRSGNYWGLGVTIVSIVLTVAGGTDDGGALFPMIAIMLVSLILARTPVLRRGRTLLPFLLVLGTLSVFYLSARATSFGLVGPAHWQALAATGPFVLLLSRTRGKAWPIVGAFAWGAVVVLMAVFALPTSETAAEIIIVAGLVGLGFSGVWTMFQRLVTRLSNLEAVSRAETFQASLHTELATVSQASYQRWMDAGLDASATLLRGIRDGRLNPHAESTRAACDEEERYLRQLVQINPDLVHIGKVFMPTLRRARELGIEFRLRLGDIDAANEHVARDISDVVSENLMSAEHGEALAVSLFPVAEGLQLTLTGSALQTPEHLADKARLVSLGQLELLEISFQSMQPVHRKSKHFAGTARIPVLNFQEEPYD
ncbi:sensor histidine kinase [Arthrobacter sp. ERGS1:01]|uniref:sensor histidine kinase n=1 Tax=Arthrobacter sp. ERGS1:01 TaxID=1704044 RepID=UPI00307C78E9